MTGCRPDTLCVRHWEARLLEEEEKIMSNSNEVNREPSIRQDVDDAVVKKFEESVPKTSRTLSQAQSHFATSL
jgi:hypothetical protein